MRSGVEVCSHCKVDYKLKALDDIGIHACWVNDYYLIDVILLSDFGFRVRLYRQVFHK